MKVARDQLRSFVERVERLEAEIAELNSDKSDIFKEAKGNGFDVKALKAVIAYRRKDVTEREQQDALFRLYLDTIEGKSETGTQVATRARTTSPASIDQHSTDSDANIVSPATRREVDRKSDQDQHIDSDQNAQSIPPVSIAIADAGDLPDFLDRRRPQ